MEENYIIAFDKMPSCIYTEHGETITQVTFPMGLIPNASWLKSGESIILNGHNYIIKDRIDLMGYVILKCKEDE